MSADLMADLLAQSPVVTTVLWLAGAQNLAARAPAIHQCLDRAARLFRDARYLVELLREHERAARAGWDVDAPALALAQVRWRQQQHRQPDVVLAAAAATQSLAELGALLATYHPRGVPPPKRFTIAAEDVRALGRLGLRLRLEHNAVVGEIGHLHGYFTQATTQPAAALAGRVELAGQSASGPVVVAGTDPPPPAYTAAAHTTTAHTTFDNLDLLRSVWGGGSGGASRPLPVPSLPNNPPLQPVPSWSSAPAAPSGLGALFGRSPSLSAAGSPNPFIRQQAAQAAQASASHSAQHLHEMPSAPPPLFEADSQAAVAELPGLLLRRTIEDALKPPATWPSPVFELAASADDPVLPLAELPASAGPAELPAEVPSRALTPAPAASTSQTEPPSQDEWWVERRT